LRSTAHSLTRIISEGTNCSPFEASIITEIAQEIFRIGDHHEKESLQVGQMIWQDTISKDEPPGKPLDECKFKRIRLTIVSIDEGIEILKQYGHSAKRGQQILRMTREVLDQRALLTQEDLAILFHNDPHRYQAFSTETLCNHPKTWKQEIYWSWSKTLRADCIVIHPGVI